jgi:phospholipid/cholesterol/gamma-HCH transport system permease protein
VDDPPDDAVARPAAVTADRDRLPGCAGRGLSPDWAVRRRWGTIECDGDNRHLLWREVRRGGAVVTMPRRDGRGLALVLLIGGAARLAGRCLVRMFTPPFDLGEILRQLDRVGVGSVNLTNITALFTGLVLALQTAYTLAAFGAELYIGEVVAMSLVRELGPVLTALMVGGRVGSGIAAEIGSMAVTEQVDALRSMAADPVRKLVVPRVWAILVALPLLTILADAMGILGGLLIAVFEEGSTVTFYFSHAFRLMEFHDLASGLGKTVFFAFLIGVIGCYNGLGARGGADGVGRATTNTVYAAAIGVLVSDFFLTKLFLSF